MNAIILLPIEPQPEAKYDTPYPEKCGLHFWAWSKSTSGEGAEQQDLHSFPLPQFKPGDFIGGGKVTKVHVELLCGIWVWLYNVELSALEASHARLVKALEGYIGECMRQDINLGPVTGNAQEALAEAKALTEN